ncbi:PrpR N-terminal domain-containing protein [Niallia sp. XMNu-256]|uniref:sigma-54-dependent Fis family transcriptional regulator n=1 Tax=Niallia sp. XMNu-256 TaxID=3082444 RepID=UPI0030CB7FFF
MIKALVIVPYDGLFEMMKEIQQEVHDFLFQIELGNLYEGVAIAKAAENDGYHVIISRGGTASMIQEAVSIPVIDIQVSGYDVLRMITLVKGFSRKAAIVGFANITQGASTICKLLDIEITTATITKDKQVKEKLERLKKDGVEVIIGDVVTINAAKELGMTGVLITSGKEAIFEALEEARRTYRVFSGMQQKVSMLKDILDCQEQGVVVINHEKQLIYGNQSFHSEFQWMQLENKQEINELIKETILTEKNQAIPIYMNQTFWNVKACPQENIIALFFEKSTHTHASQSGNMNENAIEIHTSAVYTPNAGRSESIKGVLHQIEQYGKNKMPVLIYGEKGSGKDVAAGSIYFNRKTENEPYIIFQCELLSVEQWETLIAENFFQKYANGIIYLKNMDRLNSDIQKQLYTLATNDNNQGLQWLVSSEENLEGMVKQGTFHDGLYDVVAKQIISIPPLRERREDIEDLVPVFISEFHPKYGNEVVGIRPDALEELMNYDWPGNVGQLKRVIEQLFIGSNSYYIEKKDVEKVLKGIEKQVDKIAEARKEDSIDLSGTLEEIEKQIITKVLEEEGFNQSKAAKRLGVNRSTLWRKLK